MSRETTPTKQWTDELDKRSSPNGATPKISAGWKRQLLLHAERSKKQAEKEVEKQKKIEEWRSEEKKKVVEAKASPDKATTTSPVHSPFNAQVSGRGRSPIMLNSEVRTHSDPQEARSASQRSNNRHNEQRAYGNKYRDNSEHKVRQHGDRSPSDKYGPSHRPEVESERWSRGGHSSAHMVRGGRGRERDWHSNTRHSSAHKTEYKHVDDESRDQEQASPTRASTQRGVVLVVNVELESGSHAQLQIHERDDVSRVSHDFCREHSIDRELVDLFLEEIEAQLKRISL